MADGFKSTMSNFNTDTVNLGNLDPVDSGKTVIVHCQTLCQGKGKMKFKSNGIINQEKNNEPKQRVFCSIS